ncbi:AAA family ATPase [Conchiformibius steedae]|uniref:ATP-binding protein n=1 Tax=Conchiformibius steedae TaxID=153493 RepID=A0A3P2A5Z3_9NEIS|nr:AAA family ATPase [Conchiformibius steedae]RRD90328.1 ATP-binding protein [Conchiformibius steedae]
MELLKQKMTFDKVRGVGTIEIDFSAEKRVYVVLGENGIGKTKLLEALFVFLLATYERTKNYIIETDKLPFDSLIFKQELFTFNSSSGIKDLFPNINHQLPFIYLGAQNRGSIGQYQSSIEKLGNRAQRFYGYLDYLTGVLTKNEKYSPIKSLNMDIPMEEWFIQRAQSANPYQSAADNREIEIKTLLKLLNQVDKRIDANFLEISGDNRVFLKIQEQKRALNQLSSGFVSILKILQSIIAGYGCFTNEYQLDKVKGMVLIDEIESHLHNEWQVKIIPLLKELFPNTTFIITTHSSIVLSQLQDGEAYRMQRDKDNVVRLHPIAQPNKTTLIDLLKDTFGVDFNQIRLERVTPDSQSDAKQKLLDLLREKAE